MAIQVVRFGPPRPRDDVLRIGTVRRLPRGVRKDDLARGHFDIWLPELAPSALLLSWARQQPFTAARWHTFARRYHREMRTPPAQRLLALVAALSARTELAVGCYCDDESRCHRSLLRDLLRDAGASIG
jgi:uncharacterized protein YeaO (DUF488 family)